MFSIDIETTGLDPQKHQILSIAAVSVSDITDVFYRQIEHDTYIVTPQALRVNKIDLINWKGDTLIGALDALYQWLLQRETIPITALGFNVGSFDLQFLKKAFDDIRIRYPFHYRSVDLNSCMKLIGFNKGDFDGELALKEEVAKNEKLANILKQYTSPIAHHALCDAMINVLCWKRLKEGLIK